MSIRVRLLLLILIATLIPALVAGLQFLERRDAEIAAARLDKESQNHCLLLVSRLEARRPAQPLAAVPMFDTEHRTIMQSVYLYAALTHSVIHSSRLTQSAPLWTCL